MITIPKFRTASKQNIRTFALPSENQTYTFKMQYAYDSYNRIQNMTYPDGEIVSYEYNRGGMLNKVFGSVTRDIRDMIVPVQVQGGLTEPDGVMGGGIVVPFDPPVGPIEPLTITYRYPYIDSIIYNVFELKDSVIYGNGTRVSYEYDSLQRLSHLRSYIASGTKMQDITYSYDSASNITHISNSAGSVSGLGGRYEGHYTYDNLYRLVAANGYWKNSRDSLPFNELMKYTANGRILKKTVNARILSGNHSTTKSSDFRYSYEGHGNQVSTITDNGTFPVVTQSFQWDDCGNVDRWAMLSKTGTQWLRTHTWTEDNRLQTVADNSWFSYYQYDAGGERTYKLTWAGSTSNRMRKIFFAICLLLIVCTITAQEGANPFSAYPAGSKFIHKNLVAFNGDTIKSTTLDSSFVWYNFWHTRCKPCITEMGELNRIALEYKDNPKIMFIAIACDDSTNVAEFLKSHRFEFQTIAFCKTEFLSDFPVSHFPTNILVDSNQRVVIEIIGGVFKPEQVYDHIQPLTKRLEQMIMNQ